MLNDRYPIFIVLALVAAFLSALYMARILFVVFFGRLKEENSHVHESPLLMTAPLVLLAVFALLVGFIAVDWTDTYRGLGTFLFSGEPEVFHINVGLTAAAIAMSVGGFALGWAIYHRGLISHQALARRYSGPLQVVKSKYYLDELYQWGIDRVVLAFGRLVGLFDRIVINDTGVNTTGRFVILSGLRLRYQQTGRMYNYALGMVLGVISLALIWWLGLT